MGTKLAELASGNEISRDSSIYAARVDNAVLAWLLWKRGIAFPSGLLIPLALLGLAFAPRDSTRHFLILGALASQALFVLAFFVTTRYRLTLWTSAIPYAAYALVAAPAALRAWDRPRVLGAIALALVLAAFCNYRVGKMPLRHLAFEHDHLGSVLDREGKHDQAAEQWRSAVALDPRYASAHFQLAKYYARRKALAGAASHYDQGLRAAPTAFAARVEYAKLLVRQARSSEAADQIRRVLARLPSSLTRYTVCAFAARARLNVRSECPRPGASDRGP